MIGIDEAGYGPKMGPLVIGASVWLVPDIVDADCMLDSLSPEFQSRPWQPEGRFIPMGDSKAIYQDKRHLDGLTLAIRFLSELAGWRIDSTSDLLRRVSNSDALRVEVQPWYAPNGEGTSWNPVHVPKSVLDSAHRKLDLLGIEFHGFASRIIDEEEFNRVVAIAGNKANALGEWSLSLLRECIRALPKRSSPGVSNSIEAYCDRQGGRKRYLPLLDHAFQEWSSWFDVLEEGNLCSRYRGRLGEKELMVRFQVGGDRMLPTGVASMLAKLVRELLLGRLNRYWLAQVGNQLRPTAGYPEDAARFRREIEEQAEALAHPTQAWWRSC
jgi:hypothetical protein